MRGYRYHRWPAACFLLFMTPTLPGMVAAINSAKVRHPAMILLPLANVPAGPHHGPEMVSVIDPRPERRW
jgi:hypothetical protein